MKNKIINIEDVCPVCKYCKLMKCTCEASEFKDCKCKVDTWCEQFKHWSE